MPDGTYESPLLGLSQRVPPQNQQAEQALLGALLANNRAYEAVGSFLTHEHFADPINGRIYQAIARRIEAGQLADAVTLRTELEHSDLLAPVGGVGYLVTLLTAMVGIINAGEYGRAIHDAWIRRELIEVGETVVNTAFAPDAGTDGQALVAAAMEQLMELGDAGAQGGVVGLGAAMADALADSQASATDPKRRGLTIGLAPLDRMWRGLWPGSLDILGARAETGKTALGMQIAVSVAEQLLAAGAGEHVLFFSLEMSRADLGLRQLASATGVSADDIRNGSLTNGQASALVRAHKRFLDLPLVIDDRAGLTMAQIALQSRAMTRRKRIRLLVIDHLHRIKPSTHMARMSRLDQVAEFTLSLKDLARVLRVPILLLAQLSRASDKRDDHRPTKADLMYAGEADADNILLLYRPELYLPQEAPKRGPESAERHAAIVQRYHEECDAVRGIAEVIFAKRRAGPIGSTRLRFDGVRTRFVDLAEPSEATPDLWDGEP